MEGVGSEADSVLLVRMNGKRGALHCAERVAWLAWWFWDSLQLLSSDFWVLGLSFPLGKMTWFWKSEHCRFSFGAHLACTTVEGMKMKG